MSPPNHRRGCVLPSKKAHRREAVFEQSLIKRGVKPKGYFSGFGDRRKEMLEDIAILTGGGTALIRAAQKLEAVKPENEDEKLGIEIIRRAVEEPLRMIVENAGLEGSVVVNEVKNGKGDYGYNARAEKYENLFQSGVIDPAKERESSEISPRGLGSMLLTEF